MSLMSEKMERKWNEEPQWTYVEPFRKPKMTKPKTPTLASLAKSKGCRAVNGYPLTKVLEVSRIDKPYSFLDLYYGKPGEPTRKQAFAMIHAALSVLPDVRKK